MEDRRPRGRRARGPGTHVRIHLGGVQEVHEAVRRGPRGYTSEAYRRFMKPFGVALAYTEMVSDSAMMHNRRSDEYLMFDRCPLTGIQLFGSDPERMGDAAAECVRRNPNVDLFDVNMGCPGEGRPQGRRLRSDGRSCQMRKDRQDRQGAHRAPSHGQDTPRTGGGLPELQGCHRGAHARGSSATPACLATTS